MLAIARKDLDLVVKRLKDMNLIVDLAPGTNGIRLTVPLGWDFLGFEKHREILQSQAETKKK